MRWRAILTGASGGIGRAMAGALLPHCDELVVVGRDASRLPDFPRCRPVAADITTDAGLAEVASSAPRANLLVNNAGVNDFTAFAAQDEAAMRRILETNVLAPMRLTRRMLPQLAAKPAAVVVNVGSILGYLGYPGCAAYCASKFALRGFTEALRRELADTRVRVMYLAPRTTRTSLNGAALDALNAELGNGSDPPDVVASALLELLVNPAPERRIGMPESLFAAVNQLAPSLVDRALRRQLPQIQRHLAKEATP
jgi:short-subunit dehydrogenase